MSGWQEIETTGRTRVRALKQGWGRPVLMVIQVEVLNRFTHDDWRTGEQETTDRKSWRDAKLEDFNVPEMPGLVGH